LASFRSPRAQNFVDKADRAYYENNIAARAVPDVKSAENNLSVDPMTGAPV
jgi:hypothetical protein